MFNVKQSSVTISQQSGPSHWVGRAHAQRREREGPIRMTSAGRLRPAVGLWRRLHPHPPASPPTINDGPRVVGPAALAEVSVPARGTDGRNIWLMFV